jgi:hypothetical protein
MFQLTSPAQTNEHPAHGKQLKYVCVLCVYGDKNTFTQTHSKKASSSQHI